MGKIKMTYNPNAVFISPSSIAAFKSCPKSYFYQSVYKNPKTGLKIQVINPKLALGSVVHDVLAQFLMRATDRNKDQLVNILTRYWSDITGEKGGFFSEEQESEYKKKAEKMLNTFWANPHFSNVNPVKMPDFPKLDLGEDIILTGKLDWIEVDGDGYHIIDFKTGEKEERSDSLQLPIYAVLIYGLFKNDRIRASYWYLNKDEEIKEIKLPKLKETMEDLRKISLIIKNSRLTNSFKCSSGFDSCWACRDLEAIANGSGKLVAIDYNRKQEVYILNNKIEEMNNHLSNGEDLPF